MLRNGNRLTPPPFPTRQRPRKSTQLLTFQHLRRHSPSAFAFDEPLRSLSISLSLLLIFDGGNRENLGWIFSNFARKIVFFVRYEKEKGRKEERIDGSPLENRRFFERTAQRLLLSPTFVLCRVLAWLLASRGFN